jgi:UPF0755 protein
MKKTLFVISVFLFVLLAAAAVLFADLWDYANRPISTQAGDVVVQVPPGQAFKTTAEILHKEGIIGSPFKLYLIARFKGYDKKLQAGEYLLTGSNSPIKILEKLVRGEVILHKITIPEGYTIYQIAELIAKAGLVAKDDFIRTATDSSLTRQKGIDAESFEGYLFPDTYFFPKDITAEKIISTMLDRFWSIYKPEWKDQGRKEGLSVHQVVTLASIIERETGVPYERPIISSVFHNRLKKGMRLESDPTVIYAIKDFDGNLTRKHLATATPYNTYKIQGLPPGPIANPGVESLQAALYPADTPYIYFVSKKDKTHHFSTNFDEHTRAVNTYQLKQ